MCKKNYPHIAFITKYLFKYFILTLVVLVHVKKQMLNNLTIGFFLIIMVCLLIQAPFHSLMVDKFQH